MQFSDFKERDLSVIELIENEVHAYPWTRGNFLDSMKSSHNCLMMKLDKEIIGYAIMMFVLDECHLLNLGIKKNMQKKGYGSYLLQEIIRRAKLVHSKTIYLEVRASNHVAIHLYDKSGFNEMSIRKDYYRAQEGREDAVLMGLVI
ncbi:MAG: ribosomal-protein-alanine N-acetyltransferase [Candidatus Methylopumilus sp.]|nr:ribosomal-protein-alanine N-acetyltransferase [Candidatus Methylopumilus sp.]